MSEAPNPILELTLEFSVKIIRHIEILKKDEKYDLSNQLLGPDTSIGERNETQSWESGSGFIRKMKITANEAEEIKYWLIRLVKADSYPRPGLIEKLQVIIKILNKKIVSSEQLRAQYLAHGAIETLPH